MMRNCCCCGVRGGSVASAIYSMIIAGIGLFFYAISLFSVDKKEAELYELKHEGYLGHLNVNAYFKAVLIDSTFAVISLACVFIASMFVLVGITHDNKNWLVPFILAKCITFVWYLYTIVLSIYEVAAIGTNVAGCIELVLLVILVPFFVGDVVCVLCVLSQYQEYCVGRGRLSDQGPIQRQTVIIQVPVSAGFGYQNLDEKPEKKEKESPPEYKFLPGPV